MTLRFWPDPTLQAKCTEVVEMSEELRAAAYDMLQVMYRSNGIGLAAPQVGLTVRIFVLDIWWPQTGSQSRGLVFVNPKVTLGKETVRTQEGCLSLPGVEEFITRASTVHVEAQDEFGKTFTLDADGLLAICIQHETDHLDGITMVERVGPTARRILKKQLLSSVQPPAKP